VLIPIGVVLAWFGIRGDVDASVDGSQWKVKLVTASPGVLLFICGTFIIHSAISAKIEVTAGEFHGVGKPRPGESIRLKPAPPE
jgi:hypothetical protein